MIVEKDVYKAVVEIRVFSSNGEVAGNTGVIRCLQVVENKGVVNFAVYFEPSCSSLCIFVDRKINQTYLHKTQSLKIDCLILIYHSGMMFSMLFFIFSSKRVLLTKVFVTLQEFLAFLYIKAVWGIEGKWGYELETVLNSTFCYEMHSMNTR